MTVIHNRGSWLWLMTVISWLWLLIQTMPKNHFYFPINNVILLVGVRWRTLEVHWRYEAWVTGGIEVLITWVTSMRYEGGVHKRPQQLAEVHASKPSTKSMVQRPHMRCEHTCDPANPTFCLSWPSHVTSCDHGHHVSHSWPCHENLSNSIALNFISLDSRKFSLSHFVCKSIWYCLSHNNQGKQLYDKKSLFVCTFPNSVPWENPNSCWCTLKMSVYAATKFPHSFYTW